MNASWPEERPGGSLGEEPEAPRPSPDDDRSGPEVPPDDSAPPAHAALSAYAENGGGYGRLGVGLVALFIGVPLLGLLVAYYVAQYGDLPFTFRPGPAGTPPWLPFLVLLFLAAAASFAPIVLRNLRDRELTFYDQIAINRRNSVFLTVAIAAGLGTAAYVIGTVVTLRTTGGLVAALVAIGVAVAGAILSYRAGDRIVLRISGARPLRADEQPVLHNVVNEMAIAANIPPPALYLIDDTAPNAFATGRDPSRAALAVTSGLLKYLDREELQGVVAHEVSHIRNLDSRYGLFVAVLVGTTVLIADGFFQVVTFPFRLPYRIFRAFGDGEVSSGSGRVSGRGSGGGWSFPRIKLSGGGGGGSGKGGGGAIILAIIIFIVLVIVVSAIVYAIAPVFARLTQVSVSREREYLADASAVELGRNPGALERALLTIATSKEVLEVANRATAPLYFVNPIRAFEKRASRMWSTHPPTIDRVNRLRALQGEPPVGRSTVKRIQEDVD
jgi:heat shock protein HtpX